MFDAGGAAFDAFGIAFDAGGAVFDGGCVAFDVLDAGGAALDAGGLDLYKRARQLKPKDAQDVQLQRTHRRSQKVPSIA